MVKRNRGLISGLASGLIGAAMLAAMPAWGAEHLDCALQLADSPTQAKLFEAYRAGHNLGDTLISLKGDGFRACVTAGGWNPQAVESAGRVLFGTALAEGLRAEMRANGLNAQNIAQVIDAFIDSVPEKQLGMANGEIDDPTITALLEAVINAKLLPGAGISDVQGRLMGEYASARANRVYFTAQFAKD